MSFSIPALTSRIARRALAGLAVIVAMLPGSAGAQARSQARAPQPSSGGLWIAPYFGAGFQSAYYDGVVQFSDGSSAFLTVDPGTTVVLGLQLGYRLSSKWTLQGNVSTASPTAEYIEDLQLRPENNLRTTQIEAGVLYDAASLRVGRDKAPLSVGGGLSLTSHSMKNLIWNGNAIRPSATSIGAHALAALDIPLAPRLSFHSQVKLTMSPLSRDDLEEKLAAAQGGSVTATLDGGTSTYFQFLVGAAYRP
jgi:hypothetical protein